MTRSLALVAALLAATRVSAPAQRPSSLPPDLDAHVTRALRTFQVPGAAVAIVKGGAAHPTLPAVCPLPTA